MPKKRINYYCNNISYPIRLTGYGMGLLKPYEGDHSQVITKALQSFLGANSNHMEAAQSFAKTHGMSLSMLVELSLSHCLNSHLTHT
jgi:hypothetical protein